MSVAERATRDRSIPGERLELERRARRLAWGGNGWHLIEFAIALGAGIAAGSVALIGFGADSLIEVFSGSVIAWLFTAGRGALEDAERLARRLIAMSYFVLTGYILVESLRDLIGGHHPQTSWVGIALAAVTAVTMPMLARLSAQSAQSLAPSRRPLRRSRIKSVPIFRSRCSPGYWPMGCLAGGGRILPPR